METSSKFIPKCVLHLLAVFLIALFAGVATLAQTSPPAIVRPQGYINGTPLTAHTSTPFNSTGASTLVAFVSTNTPCNGQPVSISGLSDNLGNAWNLLTGPRPWCSTSSPCRGRM